MQHGASRASVVSHTRPDHNITSSTSLTLNVWCILCGSGTPQVQNRPVLSPIGLVLYSLHWSPEALSTCNEEDQGVDRLKEPGLPQGRMLAVIDGQ